MKNKVNKYKLLRMRREARRFKKEHRKEIRLLIVLTLSFTIAFTWRQTIFDASQALINFFVEIKNSTSASIITSTFITIISLVFIRMTSHILKESNHE